MHGDVGRKLALRHFSCQVKRRGECSRRSSLMVKHLRPSRMVAVDEAVARWDAHLLRAGGHSQLILRFG